MAVTQTPRDLLLCPLTLSSSDNNHSENEAPFCFDVKDQDGKAKDQGIEI